MSIIDRFRGRSKSQAVSTQETLSGVLAKYDLVEVVENNGDPFVIVSEREPSTQLSLSGQNISQLPPDLATLELGTASPSPFTSHFRNEYNAELRGVLGLQKYDQMRRGDATVRSTLRLVKTPVLAGRWFVEPADNKTRNVNAAKFVEKCLMDYMSTSWPQLLTEILLMCDFGYYMFEKVWEERVIDGKRRMVLKKLAPRHPMDVKEWKLDANGGPRAVVMYSDNIMGQDIVIPIEKLLVFTFDKEGSNIEGMSILRSAYKHWYYKEQFYKIDAIQKERHGIGIPVIKLPVGFTTADKATADNLGRNLRTNERAHVVLPPNWDLIFAKLEGNPVDALKSIDHHNQQIKDNILAPKGGKDEDAIMFLKATRFIADIVCDVFNSYLVPQLVDYNFERVDMPKLRVRRIGESADWRTLSFAIRNLIGAGVIRPDDKLEENLRDEMDLPAVDLATVRIVKSPQMPAGPTGTAPTTPTGTPGTQNGQDPNAPGAQPTGGTKQNGQTAGMPRQSTSPVVAPPATNAGQDRSGG